MPNKKLTSKRFKNKILSDDVLSIDELFEKKDDVLKKTSKKRRISRDIIVEKSTKTKKKSRITAASKKEKIIKQDIVFEKPSFKLVEFKHEHLLDLSEVNSQPDIKKDIPKIGSLKETVNSFINDDSSDQKDNTDPKPDVTLLETYQEFSNQCIRNWFRLFKA